jgi:hypothetical protein
VICDYSVFLKGINACSGNGALDMSKDDKGNNMLDPNEEIKQSVDEIMVKINSNNSVCYMIQ